MSLSTVGAILAVLVVIVGGLATWRSSVTRVLRDERDAWKSRAERLDEELTEVKKTADTNKRQIAELQGKIIVLESVISGRAEIEALGMTMLKRFDHIDREIRDVKNLAGNKRQ